MEEILITAGFANRIDLGTGDSLEIINVEGAQVCDFFAFNKKNVKEALSPSHMRSVMRRTFIMNGDFLYSVLRNPMFEVVYDDVKVHDFSVPACDPGRYLNDFGIAQHRSCRDNLAETVSEMNIPYEYLPDPLNLFQETSVNSKGLIIGGISPAKPGDKIVLKALMDVIAVGSACPQDKAPTNNYHPTDILFRKIPKP